MVKGILLPVEDLVDIIIQRANPEFIIFIKFFCDIKKLAGGFFIGDFDEVHTRNNLCGKITFYVLNIIRKVNFLPGDQERTKFH